MSLTSITVAAARTGTYRPTDRLRSGTAAPELPAMRTDSTIGPTYPGGLDRPAEPVPYGGPSGDSS